MILWTVYTANTNVSTVMTWGGEEGGGGGPFCFSVAPHHRSILCLFQFVLLVSFVYYFRSLFFCIILSLLHEGHFSMKSASMMRFAQVSWSQKSVYH